ncbi:hypothetical protein As57867_007763, partial [Aphanomyces stellatus]
ADDDHPFRFHGLKWCATKWPGASALAKNRDLCYFESTGLAQATDNVTGALTTFGYSILESFDLAQCGHLEDLSIVRAKISIRHIFRELPIGGVFVMSHVTLVSRGSDLMALPQLIGICRVTEVAESIRLTKLLHTSTILTTSTSIDWRKPLTFLKNAVCCICRRERSKMKKRLVVETTTHDSGLQTRKRYFCGGCLLASLTKPSQPCFAMSSAESRLLRPYAMSSVSSLDLSEFDTIRHNKSANLPMLDLDSDDDEDSTVRMYTGLNLEIWSRDQLNNRDEHFSYEVLETEQEPAKRNAVMCCQLARLTACVDETLKLVRRTKLQVDFYRSHGRVEYL